MTDTKEHVEYRPHILRIIPFVASLHYYELDQGFVESARTSIKSLIGVHFEPIYNYCNGRMHHIMIFLNCLMGTKKLNIT